MSALSSNNSSTSSGEKPATTAPLCASICTSPSASSRIKASRKGIRLMPSSSARTACRNCMPAGYSPSRMRRRNSSAAAEARVGGMIIRFGAGPVMIRHFSNLALGRIRAGPSGKDAITFATQENMRGRSSMASVDVIDVRKAYGNQEVIHGVSIGISDGEFVILVGPSGCGKSTLLRMIAGLEPITSGDIRIGEKVVNDLPPKDRDIAMVFQSYALYPHKTVAENMGFALKMRHAPKAEIETRVRRAAEILDRGPYLERYPRHLSGGQRQRVAMGRAIVRDPAVFLFDEPLSNLDAKLRVQMRAEIKELHQRLKTTTIYVTHDQVEAMTMADRIVVMNNGVVEQIGSPLELYDNPTNIF